MNNGVIHFTPRAELTGEANLRAFIKVCREAPVLAANIQFEQAVWETGKSRKGVNHTQRVAFVTFEAARARGQGGGEMEEPFASFAKAVVVYLEDRVPVVDQSARIGALRLLEAALRQQGKANRPTAITHLILDAAQDLARRNSPGGFAYALACQLEAIARLLREKRILRMTTEWKHSVKKRRELGSRIDQASIEARKKKMPSPAAIRGLAGVFITAVGVADTMVSSAATLLLCAPERINEVTRLRRNCLVHGEGRFAGAQGIRWAGSKGFEDAVKWLPTVMAGVAHEAVARLAMSSRAAHDIASWYVGNPGLIYLPEETLHLRGKELLTMAEVSSVLWGAAGGAALQWCRDQGLEVHMVGRLAHVKFSDVQRTVLSMLPKTFPYLPGDGHPIRVDEALCIIRKNELHADRAAYVCMFDLIDENDIVSRLGQRNQTGIASLFERYGFTEDDGTPIVIRSHAFRHYLNTLAQLGGMTEVQIAVFSGRKDVRQNSVYDHMTSDEAQAPIRAAMRDHGFMTGLVAAPSRSPVARGDFAKLGLAAAHTTEFGFCRHDFAAEPCQMHRDCLNCEEQECVKGDAHKEANLRGRISETEHLLAAAKQALAEEEYGADRWVLHQQNTLRRAKELLALLSNPDIPDGTRLRLASGQTPMPIGHQGATAVHVQLGHIPQELLR